MFGRLSKTDRPDVLAFLRKNECVEPRIQKSKGTYPYLSVIFPVVDHEQRRIEIEVGHKAKRYPMLLLVDTVFRTIE